MKKKPTTPGYYPLTLNSLQAACNQSTSRQPVTQLEEAAIEFELTAMVHHLRSELGDG